MEVPLKTVARKFYLLKSNRPPAKVDGYFSLSFFSKSTINLIKAMVNIPKAKIN